MRKLATKPLPDPRSRDLLPPDMDYLYFDASDDVPLEPRNTDYSSANAWWFSESAFLAYCHPGYARMAFKLAGLDQFRFFQGLGTECMVSWNRRVVIVSFRGTELKSRSVFHEIWTDLNTVPVSFDTGGQVHKGFLMALDEIWPGGEGLESLLTGLWEDRPRRPIWITGHSLGGALAILSFARFTKAKGAYVFGAPRVGDGDFAALLADRPIWRIENARDPIPLVPPNIPSIDFNFHDLGQLRFLKFDGTVVSARPEFIHADYKTRYLEAKQNLDRRIQETNALIERSAANKEGPRKIWDQVKNQFRQSATELKDQIDDFVQEHGLSADDHQPIFYTVKLWNALVGGAG